MVDQNGSKGSFFSNFEEKRSDRYQQGNPKKLKKNEINELDLRSVKVIDTRQAQNCLI